MKVLAVDGGQSGIRLRLAGQSVDGDGVLGAGDVQQQLARAVSMEVARRDWKPDIVAAGLSGLADGEAAPALLLDAVPSASVALLAHDSVTSMLGALAARPGAVVAAGTGVVTLATGPGGVARIDGHGHLVGDAGSGFWLGRAGLEAALRAHDGRGPETSLTAAAHDAFGPLHRIGHDLQRSDDRVARIAAFARAVLDALDDRDAIALAIAVAGADELAASAAAGLARIDADADARVSWAGSLLTSSVRYRALFETALAARRPASILVPPAGDGLDGATELVRLRPDSSLYPLVHRASRERET